MLIKLLSSFDGVQRIDFEGRIAHRAIELGSRELPSAEQELRDKLLANFRAKKPESMTRLSKGSGLPTGYYVFDSYVPELREFLKDEQAHAEAASDLKAARYYGAGRKKGGEKAFRFDIEVEVGSETVRFEGSFADMKNIMTHNLRENARLNAEVQSLTGLLDVEKRKVDLLTRQRDRAYADIRDLLDNGSVKSKEPEIKPVSSVITMPKSKPRVRAVNGALIPVDEFWKTIPKMPHFEVSNFGRFRRCGQKRTLLLKRDKNGMLYCAMWRIVDGRKVGVSANTALLVAEVWMPAKAGPILHFKDHNRSNIHFENLEWLPLHSPKRHKTDIRPRANRQELAA